MDNILGKYAGNHEPTSYDKERTSITTSRPIGRYDVLSSRDTYRPGVKLDRFTSKVTSPPISKDRYDYGASAESFVASLYENSPEADDNFYNYRRYTSRLSSSALAEERERIRRAEIEELLNKYAPMH